MEKIIEKLKNSDPVVWLFYGDSITHGAYHTLGWKCYPELFFERVRSELGRTMDVIINTAISGDNSRGLLNSYDQRVSRFRPDVVFVMIGMNDCSETRDISEEQFEQNLYDLCGKLKNDGATIVLQTTCPIMPGTSPDRLPHFPKFMDRIRGVAKSEDIALIDHTQYWAEHSDVFYYWMSNPFHPNEYGHRAFAKLIFQQLKIWDPESPTCRLLIP